MDGVGDQFFYSIGHMLPPAFSQPTTIFAPPCAPGLWQAGIDKNLAPCRRALAGPSARKVLDLGQASPMLERRLVKANVKGKV
jgi:hypothetical protein